MTEMASTLVRYARLLGVQVRASLLLALQYRLEFAVETTMSLFWTATALIPLLALYERRPSIAGWTEAEALLVVGFFTALKGVLEGAVQPSLSAVVEHVRKGTLDFVLLKPVDAQFLVSTTKLDVFKAVHVATGLGIVGFGLRALGRVPSPLALAIAIVLFGVGAILVYSIHLLVVALAFKVVKVDNLSFLFSSAYDAARWPSSVFRGAAAVVFTFVLPLAVMTTFPALALLDRLPLRSLALAVALGVGFGALSRFAFLRALASYTSAGG
jgi:ABC-2 type transport system permease protein